MFEGHTDGPGARDEMSTCVSSLFGGDLTHCLTHGCDPSFIEMSASPVNLTRHLSPWQFNPGNLPVTRFRGIQRKTEAFQDSVQRHHDFKSTEHQMIYF